MSRNKAIKLVQGSVFGMLISSTLFAGNKPSEKPNILLFIADDMTWRDCTPYGNSDVITPNIQRLANQGVCFDNMYTATAMCAPTRQQLYTGIYPVRNGAYPNHSRIFDGVKTFATYFNEIGYRTALIGKQHYGPEEAFPLHYFGGRHHDDGSGTDIELGKIKDLIVEPDDKPYFLVVAENQPHEPWNRGSRKQYEGKNLNIPEYLINSEFTKKMLVNYYSEITYADSLLGVCLNHIEQSKTLDNTIVIFTTEQGSSLPFGKWTCYDLGLKTGFIVRWPEKIKARTRNSAYTQYVDVIPTLLKLAGANPQKMNTGSTDKNNYSGFDGMSFDKVLLGKSNKHREYVFGVQTTRGIYFGPEAYAIRSIRSNRYKLIWNLEPQNTFTNMVTNSKKGIYADWKNVSSTQIEKNRTALYQTRPEFEMFDMVADPFELKNIAEIPEIQKERKKLFEVLKKWMAQQGDLGHETEMRAKERQMEGIE